MYHYDVKTKKVLKLNEEGAVLATYRIRSRELKNGHLSDTNRVVSVYENGKHHTLQLWKIIAVELGIIPESELISSKSGRGEYRCHNALNEHGFVKIITKNGKTVGSFKNII